MEFDGYMVLKSSLHGDKIPICRVEDLEVTLVSPDLPIKVRLISKTEQNWRSLSEVRAAEVQCMQLALALLARHESEMYVTLDANRESSTNHHQRRKDYRTRILSDPATRRHHDEFDRNQVNMYNATEKQMRQVSIGETPTQRTFHRQTKDDSMRTTNRPIRHTASDRFYGTTDESKDSHRTPQRISNNYKTKTNSS